MHVILTALGVAIRSIRDHLFHTLLSILGIVIGVAALVAMLALIDGLEGYVRAQITKTTSLETITVGSKSTIRQNGVTIRNPNVKRLERSDYLALKDSIGDMRQIAMIIRFGGFIQVPDSSHRIGAQIIAAERFHRDSMHQNIRVMVNESLIKKLNTSTKRIPDSLSLNGHRFAVAGLHNQVDRLPTLIIPLSWVDSLKLSQNPPTLMVDAPSVERILPIKATIEAHLSNLSDDIKRDFSIQLYQNQAQQIEQGFDLFRAVMGLVIGLAVVVGGVGIMNVLLITITERTSEIGIRKAIGAKRKDIFFQYLTEAVFISAIGCAIGLLLGLLIAFASIPIINSLFELSFSVKLTGFTIGVVATVALIIGLVFGTVPAIRASKLLPIEAIQRA